MQTDWIKGKKLLDILTWGKHLLFAFTNGTVRVHLGLFGDILVNERKKVNRSFFLEFAKGEINGYVVRALKLKKPVDEEYDWRVDILSDQFDAAYVKSLLKKKADKSINDVLMDQQIFRELAIRSEMKHYTVQASIH
jgi:endonuclease-8